MPRSFSNLRRISLVVAALVLVAALAVASVPRLREALPIGPRAELSAAETDSEESDSPAPPDEVALTPGKIESVGLRLESARLGPITEAFQVPGTVEVDPERSVEIRPRVTGIVRSLAVVLGQRVRAGETLAVLDSVEVGAARLDLRARHRDLILARDELEWEAAVAENVEQMTDALRRGDSASTLEAEFAGKPLGDQRAMLLAAYANLEAARLEEDRQSSLARDQVVGEPKAALARRARLAAQATFDAALEQVRYDSHRSRLRSQQNVRLAEAALADARYRLEILGVAVEDPAGTDDPASEAAATPEDLTAYRVVAPFDGTIVARNAVPSQRVEPIDVMMTLVDMSEVHAVAFVPESQFAFLPSVDVSIRLTAAAYPGRVFEARVHSVGAQVDPQTRTVPIHTHVENEDEALRLGMFLDMELTRNDSNEALTVPAAAVVEIEGRPAVFVPGSSARSFRLHPVEPGRRVGDRRVILAGLEPGQTVVAEGAFALKSELILQSEPED